MGFISNSYEVDPYKTNNNETEEEGRLKALADSVETDYGSVAVRSSARKGGGSTFLEPVLLVFLLAKTLSDIVITNLLEYKTCRVELALPDDNCTDPMTTVIEQLVQPNTAQIITGRALVEAFIPSCMAVLIGPWSDSNGRKPFLVIALAGVSVTYLSWGCLAMISDLKAHMLLLGSLPLALTGGNCAIILLGYCYIADVTDEHTRSFRLSVLTMATYCSQIFGTALAPFLVSVQQSPNPYPLIFFLNCSLLLLSAAYTHLFIKESVDVQPVRETRFFLCSHIQHLFSACFQPRNGHGRPMILLIIASLTLNAFINEGENAVLYLSVRERFSWVLSDYSEFNCFANVTLGLGALSGVWLFSTLLKLPDMFIVTLLFASRSARSVLMAFARSSFNFYVAAAVGTFVAAHSPLCRTELSRLVPKHDLGKVFALTGFMESLTPIGATPLYTLIYEITFLDFVGAIFLFSAALAAITVLMIMIVFIVQKLVQGECYTSNYKAETLIQVID